jgi:hypothetical protein
MKTDHEKELPLTRRAFTSGLTLALLSRGAEAQQPTSHPNIVFILMDNLGYGELGAYGGGITRGAPTPRIDQLASEGTRLTNFNVEAQCTPSRSAIMTGRFAIRSGTHSIPIGGGLDGLTQWEVTIAQRSRSPRGFKSDSGTSDEMGFIKEQTFASPPAELLTISAIQYFYGDSH